MAKTKSNIPENETDAQKLKRIGDTRVNKLLNGLAALGNLGKLKPSAKQTEAVFAALKKATDTAYSRWKGEAVAESGFSIPA